MYTINTYGLVLELETMQEIIANIESQNNGIRIDLDSVYAGDLPDYVKSAEYFTEAEAFFMPFAEKKEVTKFDGSFGIIRLSRQPSVFNRTYDCIEEMIQEIRKEVGEYLPDDFNYNDGIGQLVGEEMN